MDIKDSSGFTPLHMAAKTGSVSVCHTLITLAGTDPYAEVSGKLNASSMMVLARKKSAPPHIILLRSCCRKKSYGG